MGIDPSFRNWGLALAHVPQPFRKVIQVEDLRLLETKPAPKGYRGPKSWNDLHTAMELRDRWQEVMTEWDPDVVVTEVPSGTQSARASWTLGIALGLLTACPKDVVLVTPTEAKVALTGNKGADKNEMIRKAAEMYPDAPWLKKTQKGVTTLVAKNEHLADAIAIIYAGAVKTDVFEGYAK